LPVFLAKPKKVSTVVDKIYDLSYSNALGLILWENKNKSDSGWNSSVSLGGLISKIPKWIKSLMP
jgi:hypothetical protein